MSTYVQLSRQDFEDWIETHIHQAGSFAEHLTLVGTELECDV